MFISWDVLLTNISHIISPLLSHLRWDSWCSADNPPTQRRPGPCHRPGWRISTGTRPPWSWAGSTSGRTRRRRWPGARRRGTPSYLSLIWKPTGVLGQVCIKWVIVIPDEEINIWTAPSVNYVRPRLSQSSKGSLESKFFAWIYFEVLHVPISLASNYPIKLKIYGENV